MWGQPPPAVQPSMARQRDREVPAERGATMKCEWVHENILLHIYNELPDDARYELEQHVARCADCAAELKAARHFHASTSNFTVDAPPPNLRPPPGMPPEEALETTEQ